MGLMCVINKTEFIPSSTNGYTRRVEIRDVNRPAKMEQSILFCISSTTYLRV